MKKRNYICSVILLLASLSLLIACQPDADESDDLLAETSVNVVVNTRASGETDGDVRSLRLVVTGWTDSGTGTVSYNRLNQSPEITTGFTVKARKGNNNFYLIANETPDMTSALDALKTAADVDQFKIKFKPLKAGESPVMFGVMKKVAVNAADKDKVATVTYTDAGTTYPNQNKLPLTLTRTSARFSLAFIKKSAAFTVKNLSFKVLRIPSYSCLGENQTYPGTQWSTETLPQSSTTELTVNNTATWNASTGEYTYGKGDKISFDDFYLPEHLLTDAHLGNVDFSTVLIVNGTCVNTGGREQDANWQVNLMANELKIKRNTHYKIAVSITGLGAMGMSAEVMPVTEHDIPVNWDAPDGLAIVSDRESDYGKNINIVNDVTAYSGILKLVKNVSGKATYSDVLFKFGSVVGVSASAGSSGSGYNSTTDILYDPALTGKTYTVASWVDIPSSAVNISGTNNTFSALRSGRGDPCQLLGVTTSQMEQGRYTNGLWHTATEAELTLLINNGNNRIDGTSVANSRGFCAFHQLLLPATAYRNNDGKLASANKMGYYLSGSTKKGLSFDASVPASPQLADFSANTQSAYTVRCVRNTIPATVLNTVATSVGYLGGGFTVDVKSNIPYWKAELVGTPSGVTFANTTGKFASTLSGTVTARKETTDRQFSIRFSGTGYDGKTETRTVDIIQQGFVWKLSIVSNTLPATIPKAGGTYRAVVKLEPMDVNLPAGTQCTLSTQINGVNQIGDRAVSIDAVTREATFEYTVPANNTTASRMMTFMFKTNMGGYDYVTVSSMQSK